MHKIIMLSFTFYIVVAVALNETIRDNQQKNGSTPDTQNISTLPTNVNSFWINRPISHLSQYGGVQKQSAFRQPHKLTRLSKSFSYDFEPMFNKGSFEPFERRRRPVTLVAFRKNGFVPRRLAKIIENTPLEVAELQSPFNEVSDTWQQELDV